MSTLHLRYFKFLRGAWLGPILCGVTVSAIVTAATGFLAKSENRRFEQESRIRTLQQISMLRADAETAINKRVHLTLGLRAHVACNPDINQLEFATFAEALMHEGDGIRSVTLIKDNVISDVYPRAGNEQAIGFNLLEHPKQRESAIRSIESGRPVLDGPISLVQGGEAFVNRAPVFISQSQQLSPFEEYWGMVSILIDKSALLQDITEQSPADLAATIVSEDELGNRTYILGEESIDRLNPIESVISLPTGNWKILGAPKSGWPAQSPHYTAIHLIGGLVSIISGLLIFMVMAANARYRAARKEALAAALSKTEFLANMSHEIRTPLTAILGFADMIKVSEPDDVQSVETIRRNGKHLLTVINDILDLSKLDAGKVNLELIDFSLPEMMQDVRDLMLNRAEDKGIDLVVEFDGMVPEIICTDPTRIRQILLNLVGNAIKFTEQGQVRLAARFLPIASPPFLEFEISDTGIGMQQQEMERLFQAFHQADTSVSRRFGGTGLGLAICQRLCAMLGGDVSVSSRPGLGSTFCARVQITTDANAEFITALQREPVDPKQDRDASPRKRLESVRILLVEDGPDNRILMSRVLENAGAEVEMAENGEVGSNRALEALAAGNPFDIVLMDMQMPVLDGYSATERLRQMQYSRPIIALTAHSMAEDRKKCLDAGCDDYSSKPIQPNKLVETCMDWATSSRDTSQTAVVDA